MTQLRQQDQHSRLMDLELGKLFRTLASLQQNARPWLPRTSIGTLVAQTFGRLE